MTDRIKSEKGNTATAEREFHRTMRALVRVPKSEVEEQERKEREKARKREKPGA
jgi:hypothetical protein